MKNSPDIAPYQEWLAMRIEAMATSTYAFSNAPAEATLQFLAGTCCVALFVER